MIAGGNHTSVSCREAAKGVSSVTLSCYHSTNHTPSVSLCSTAPPPGSRECTKPPLKGLAGVAVLDGVQLLNAKLRRRIAPEGSAAVRRIPIGMHQGEFVQAHLAPPLGELSSKARLRGAARSHGYRKTKANPYNPERTLYGFALDFIKPWVLTATPQPLRRQLSSALSGCTPSRTATPAKPFRGAWGCGSFNGSGRRRGR